MREHTVLSGYIYLGFRCKRLSYYVNQLEKEPLTVGAKNVGESIACGG